MLAVGSCAAASASIAASITGSLEGSVPTISSASLDERSFLTTPRDMIDEGSKGMYASDISLACLTSRNESDVIAGCAKIILRSS